jgi:hypothetical protein
MQCNANISGNNKNSNIETFIKAIGDIAAWWKPNRLSSSSLTYNTTAITASGNLGSSSLTVSATTGMVTGMYLRLNHAITGEIVHVTNIAGTTLTIDTTLSQNYSSTAVFFGSVSSIACNCGGTSLVQSTGSKQPVFVNIGGINSVKFDGLAHAMQTSASLDLTGTNKLTVFFVHTKPSPALECIVLELSAAYASNAGSFVYYYNSTLETLGVLGNVGINRGTVTSTFTKCIFTGLYDFSKSGTNAGEVDAKINDVLKTKTPVSSNNNTANFGNHTFYAGGRAAGSLFSPIELFELLIFKKELTSAQNTLVYNYLKNSHGI